jgi:signal transduction histidine kinase
MVVQAGAAEQVVDDDPEYVRGALAAIRSAGTSSLDEVRRVVSLLRETDAPDGLAPQPGMAAIGELVAAAQSTGLDVEFEMSGEPGEVAPGLGLTVYRIVQEALTNVRKHSDARRARVTVHCSLESVTVEVEDDGSTRGRVRASDGATGHGLIGMRERAAIYGGRFDAGVHPDGFRVRAVIPRVAA